MSSDALAYKFRPRGHAASGRRDLENPAAGSRLEELAQDFERYLEAGGDSWGINHYDAALRALGGRKYNSRDVNNLLILNQDLVRTAYVGQFASAVYNTNDETEIVLDTDLEQDLGDMALYLPEGKTFVNKSRFERTLGHSASGTIINYSQGHLGDCGWGTKGPVVNYGSVSKLGEKSWGLVVNYGYADSMGAASNGVLINFGTADWHGMYSHSVFIEMGRTENAPSVTQGRFYLDQTAIKGNPGLRDYFLSLMGKFEDGKRDYRAVVALLNELGPEPHKRIERDIKEIIGYHLEAGGHDA